MKDGVAVWAENIQKTYRTGGQTTQALRGVSLSVRNGEVVCLLGPNGAGKTTLVKVLSTLLIPDEGSARVGGYDVLSEGDRVRNVIGYAGQDSERSAYFRLTARENLLFFAKAFYGLSEAEARRRVDELADILGCEDRLDSYFITLSGGEKQMFVVMRSLISQPEIVFMDEPSKSLDPVAAHKMRSFLKGYAKDRGAALLVTTHNMMEAEYISDRAIMINKGEVLFDGTPEDMTASVMKTQVIDIGGNSLDEELRQKVASLPGVISLSQAGPRVRLYCEDAYDVLPKVVDVLKDGERRPAVGIEHLTLEEAFKLMVEGEQGR